MAAGKSITDLPEDGARQHFKGTVEDPKGYWATYCASTDTWERDR